MSGPVRGGPRYCDELSLAYAGSRWRPEPGAGLSFDESYRVAHLPLVAPEHPRALAAVPHLDYERGRYAAARHSLIVPVDAGALGSSAVFQTLERELRHSSCGAKVAWSMLERRASKLHVTLAGGLQKEDVLERARAVARLLDSMAPVRYRVGGPFCGTKNRGRIYFAIYPELVDGEDSFARLQDAAGVARTYRYLLGYYNLAAELEPSEAAELGAWLDRHRGITCAELAIERLSFISTHDDLALDSCASCDVAARAP